MKKDLERISHEEFPIATKPDPFKYPVENNGKKTIRQDFSLDIESPNAAEIISECDAIKQLLLSKNAAYGNSALNPIRIFSKAETTEQIKIRIDDKLSRLARGSEAGEDVELDLIGYLILLRVARKIQNK